MTVTLEEPFTFEPDFQFRADKRRGGAGALPLAKSIIDAAQIEANQILEDAKRNVVTITQDAHQSGYEEGMNRAAGEIFAAAELEYRCAEAVVRYALPILCEALGREFGIGRQIGAMEAAVTESLRQKRLAPPFTIAVSELGATAIGRILARNGTTEKEASVLIDNSVPQCGCRITNSAGTIEIDIKGHLEGFLRRIARHQELRDALIEDLLSCVSKQR